MNTQILKSKSPISLALLMYVTTVSAMLIAVIQPLFASNADDFGISNAIIIVIAGCIGILFGLAVGTLYFRNRLAMAAGIANGLCVGVLCGALVQIPSEHFNRGAIVCFAGSLMLIILLCFAARFQKHA